MPPSENTRNRSGDARQLTSETLEGNGAGQLQDNNRGQILGEITEDEPVDDSVELVPEANDDAEDIDAAIAQATRERDKLLKHIQLKNLRGQIQLLDRQNRGEPILAEGGPHIQGTEEERVSTQGGSHQSSAVASVAGTKRSRSDSVIVHPVAKRTSIKPGKIPDYWGKSLREHTDWVRDCDVVFRRSSDHFVTHTDRILYAMYSLKGDPKEQWYEWEKNHPVEESDVIWDDFTEFLKDLIQDPVHRAATIAQALQDAKQRPTQSARNFDAYMATLENQLPKIPESYRVSNYLTKLRPELRAEILKSRPAPETRADMVALAALLEDNTPSRYTAERKRDEPGSQGKSKGKDKKSNSGSNNQRSLPSRVKGNANDSHKKSKEVTCYHCNQKGHIRPDCPQLPKDNERADVGAVEANIQDASESRGKGNSSGNRQGPGRGRK